MIWWFIELPKEKHDQRLETVLRRICELNLPLNKDKFEFGTEELTFVGHKITAEGFSSVNLNVKAVKEFRVPQNVEQVTSFSGLVYFSARFMSKFATISESFVGQHAQGH